MRSLLLVPLFALAACKSEQVTLPAAVEMTADTLGFYCQMDLANHDGPKGQAHLDGMPAPIFFSQVRDAIAYLHMPEQSHAVTVTYVQDMTEASWAQPGAWIRAQDALFVLGSDAVGGMGAAEFVPFSDRAAAEAFVSQRGGRVLSYAEIRPEDVLGNAPATTDTAADTDDIAARLRALSQ